MRWWAQAQYRLSPALARIVRDADKYSRPCKEFGACPAQAAQAARAQLAEPGFTFREMAAWLPVVCLLDATLDRWVKYALRQGHKFLRADYSCADRLC